MSAREPIAVILGGPSLASGHDVPIDRAHGGGLLARLDLERLGLERHDPPPRPEHRFAEADFVGSRLVARIDPPLRLSPHARLEAGGNAHDVGEVVGFGHMWALCCLSYLFAAELAAGDVGRWLTAVTGIGLHRYFRWDDERAHLADASTWAHELRAAHGRLLGDLYDVLGHQDPQILGSIAARLGLPEPRPARSLWEIGRETGEAITVRTRA